MDRRSILIGSMAAMVGSAARAQAPAETPVACPAGRFVGTRDGSIRVFRGIRYGRAARFQAPVAEPASAEPILADRFGPIAPQASARSSAPQSEDCLFLNIWTPEARPGARLPVMLYIHGGAYSNGTSTDPQNDGRRLAERGNVVVTVNHRLGALGYLYLARLDPRFADSGNLGQLDLILALQWVQANIAAFGGDPGRVLVFGQSGGGAKIATMMGMPAARGLFHRAVTMSGQQVTASGPLNATARARAYLDKLGVHEPGQLLELPVERLVEGLAATDPILGGGVYFGPVLDMKWLVRHPFWPDANPQSNPVPMLLGNTHDETRAFIPPDSARVRDLSWDNLAERMAPELRIDVLPEWVIAQFRARYPDWSPREVFYAATTAGRSWRGQVIEAEARANANAPTWVYQVDFASPVEPERRAPHAIDIPLAFGTLDAPGSITGTGADARAASQAVQDAFARFAATGMLGWPQYRLDRRATMVFDVASRVVEDPRRWERELFARVPYIQPGT
jgi:para-nitrobenzyl esterase